MELLSIAIVCFVFAAFLLTLYFVSGDNELVTELSNAQQIAHRMFCKKSIERYELLKVFWPWQIPKEFKKCRRRRENICKRKGQGLSSVCMNRARFRCAKQNWNKFKNHEKFTFKRADCNQT